MNRLNLNFDLLDIGYSNHVDAKYLPRHRWYYYKEGFSPNLVERAINQVGLSKNDLVIDPFNGSGTTTLTAATLGYRSVGVEVNPFTSFLASAKLTTISQTNLRKHLSKLISSCDRGAKSPLERFSTFSYQAGLDKWLFNKNILTAFEGGWRYASNLSDSKLREVLKLLLISAAMANCNAIKDGKCLRYRATWKKYNYDHDTFIQSILEKFVEIDNDIVTSSVINESKIITGDIRQIANKSNELNNFKLCITSPPYLNTFDYTDIYRPELFLGKHVANNEQLYNLRLQTVRSHVQAKWKLPQMNNFGALYDKTMRHLNDNVSQLMDKAIPLMVQAYFEDMFEILLSLREKAAQQSQLWLVVSNSAYANHEIPVDLIVADIGASAGWFLKEISVLRYIQKRKTTHSKQITDLRESIIILTKSKFIK